MSEYSNSNPSEGASPSSPAHRKTKREGNDSLWKRARRTLGTSSLTFLQPQSRPSRGSKSDGSGPAAPSKRREQVRHAQRTHRQRTQHYIKTLESEVVRLRGSENTLIQERDNLQGKLEILRTTCQLAGIPLPPGVDKTHEALSQRAISRDSNMPATVSMHEDSMSNQRLHVQWPSPQTCQTDPRFEGNEAMYGSPKPLPSMAGNSSPDSQPSLPNDLNLQPFNVSGSAQAVYPMKTPTLDTPDVAIDFVLALEHPCMTHIPHPTNTSRDPSNHVLMASTPLMSRAPSPPQPDSSWTASAAIIKELLNLSSSINLNGEITPVEVWHRLRQHPDFCTMDRRIVEELKNELSQAVKCCGFGAVLDENVFSQILQRTLFTKGQHNC